MSGGASALVRVLHYFRGVSPQRRPFLANIERESDPPKAPQRFPSFVRCGFTRHTPIHELRDIHAPLADLRFMHENMGNLEFFSELSLGKFCFLSHLPEKPWEMSIPSSMLRFGHAGYYPALAACYRLANRLLSGL